jgi:hypothetical protein
MSAEVRSSGATDQENVATTSSSAYDRIQLAVHYGKISLKDGVLLTAKLLYAPQSMPAGSEYAQKPGEPVLGPQEDLTGFFKDVHRVKGELTESERSWLKSLSADLKAILGQGAE